MISLAPNTAALASRRTSLAMKRGGFQGTSVLSRQCGVLNTESLATAPHRLSGPCSNTILDHLSSILVKLNYCHQGPCSGNSPIAAAFYIHAEHENTQNPCASIHGPLQFSNSRSIKPSFSVAWNSSVKVDIWA